MTDIERLLLTHLATLGYTHATDAQLGPDGSTPEREAYSDVLLLGRLTAAIDQFNPLIPAAARHDALTQVVASTSPSLNEENRRLHKLIVDGVPVECYADDGTIRGDTVRLLDFADPDANDWLALSQFTAIENGIKRRADGVLFVNGLPLVVIELKNAGDEQATLSGAFNQLQTYKAQIPSLFRTNAVLVTADGLTARIGSLTADAERFMPWRTTDGRTISPDTLRPFRMWGYAALNQPIQLCRARRDIGPWERLRWRVRSPGARNMAESSIAQARSQLTRLIHQAEGGDTVYITRRGKPVAVLLSQDEYVRLRQGREPQDFWDSIVEMRSDPGFEPVDWSADEVDSWRDRRLQQGFQWPA